MNKKQENFWDRCQLRNTRTREETSTMATSLYSTTTSAMIANFPEMVSKIVGELPLRKLIHVLNTHLIACAQSHMSTASPLNLLHLCIPPEIYQQYTAALYPGKPIGLWEWDGNGQDTALRRTKAKALWDKMNKHFTDEQTMNRVLVTILMNHLDQNYIQSYQHENSHKPNW